MLNQPTFEKLVQMRLSAMALAFRQQTEDPSMASLSFEDRFGMLVDAEYWSRHNNRLKRNIHKATLEQPQASSQTSTMLPGGCWTKNLSRLLAPVNTSANNTTSLSLVLQAAVKRTSAVPLAWRLVSRDSP